MIIHLRPRVKINVVSLISHSFHKFLFVYYLYIKRWLLALLKKDMLIVFRIHVSMKLIKKSSMVIILDISSIPLLIIRLYRHFDKYFNVLSHKIHKLLSYIRWKYIIISSIRISLPNILYPSIPFILLRFIYYL